MQKEDLLKRIRLWATIITSAFVVLIVALVIQFGLIAYNNSRASYLQEENLKNQQQIDDLNKDKDYYENGLGDDYLIENGKKPK